MRSKFTLGKGEFSYVNNFDFNGHMEYPRLSFAFCMSVVPVGISFVVCVIVSLSMMMFSCPELQAQDHTVTYFADPSDLPREMPVTIKHLTAKVSFKPEQNLVMGFAEFRAVPNRDHIDSILVHAPDFGISAVKINGNPVSYHQTGTNLVIEPGGVMGPAGKQLISTIAVEYTAQPMKGGIFFIGWRPEEAGKRKQIWAHRPHGWLPYIEGRITVDMYITFDDEFNVFSNGERREVKKNKDRTQTWHYVMTKDHPFFSTALAIGDYEYQSGRTPGGTPLELLYYKGMADRVPVTYKYTEQMFDFFEQQMGVPYPYPLYREIPVIDYMYGGMETTTSTIFGDYMLIDPRAWWQRNYVNVNAHELAHQWFGDCVSHFLGRDVWLTESFGTYYAKMFERSVYGDDYYQNIRNDEMTLAFDAARRNSYPIGGTKGGTQRIYQKGSLVLDMLHDVMGDDPFRRSIRLYLQRFRFKAAQTGDFTRCVYDACGSSYSWFFDQWILRGGEPHYKVTDTAVSDASGASGTLVKIWQVQEVNDLNGLFRMPVSIEVHYRDGSVDQAKPWIEKSYHEILIPNPQHKEVDFVLFDPTRKILKKLTYERSYRRLLAQATKAAGMIDRYDAWLELRQVTSPEKSAALADAYGREHFWLIRSEILKQLSAELSPESVEIFRQAIYDKDANVRKAALLNLTRIPDHLRSGVEMMLYDSSYLNVELALENLCNSFPSETAKYLELTKEMEGWRGKNIRMKWLEISIRSGNKDNLSELIAYAGPRYEFETRINAFNLMRKLNYRDAATLAFAEAAGKHWNNKLSSAARDYLKQVVN